MDLNFLPVIFACLFPGIFLAGIFIRRGADLFIAQYLAATIILSWAFAYAVAFAINFFAQISAISLISVMSFFAVAGFVFGRDGFFEFANALKAVVSRVFNGGISFELNLNSLGWLAVSAVLVFQFLNSAFFPFIAYDAVASYSPLVSRMFFAENLEFPGYPIFVPILYLEVYLFSGAINQNLAHALVPVAGLIVFVYTALLCRAIGASTLIASLVLLASSWFLIHFNSGYADLFVAAFATAAFYYAYKFVESGGRNRFFLALSAISAILAIHSKVQALYLLGGLPLALFLGLYAGKRLRASQFLLQLKNVNLIAVLIFFSALFLPTVFLYSQGSGLQYAEKTFSKHSAGEASDLEWLWGKERASDYLSRIAPAFASFVAETPFPIWFFVFGGLAYSALAAWKGNIVQRMLFPFVATFLIFWVFLLSFEVRHLSLVYPLLAVGAAAFVHSLAGAVKKFAARFFQILEKNSAGLLALLLAGLLLFPTMGAIEKSMKGYTIGTVQAPSLFWTAEHLFDSDDEKLSAFLGNFYRAVVKIKQNPEMSSSLILTMDPRIFAFLPSQKYSVENATHILYIQGDYFRHWNKPSWAGTKAELALAQDGMPYFERIFSQGQYVLYKINYGEIEKALNQK